MPKSTTPTQILQEINPKKAPYPIYLLQGDESFYVDKIEQALTEAYAPEETRDFNFALLYGPDVTGDDVIVSARRYPMMSERTMLVVREAQGIKNIELLQNLVDYPVAHNVTVLCFKNKRLDARSALYKGIEKVGLVVESPEIKLYQLDTHVRGMCQASNVNLTTDALQLLIERVGTDLRLMEKQVEKLAIYATGEQVKQITPDIVRNLTGVSREYNSFELRKALSRRDTGNALRIAQSLSSDPKKSPIQMIIATLFNFFSEVYLGYHAPRNDARGLMEYLNIKSEFMVRDHAEAIRRFNSHKVAKILSYIRHCDARSKGMYGDTNPDVILFDLVYYILH